MKILFFNDFRLGVLKGDAVVDVMDVVRDVPHVAPHDLINNLIERFEDYRPRLQQATASGKGIPVASVEIRPPLPRPVNVVCIAENYLGEGSHVESDAITGFLKSPGTIIGNGESIVLPDVPFTCFEGEAELAAVVGKRAFQVKADQAMDYVFGYINFIDGSARGLKPLNHNHLPVKSRATFAPIGPYLVTADEIADPHRVQVKLWVNGSLKQDFDTSGMAHKIPQCIEWVSSIHPLEPGDILATGTHHDGLSSFQDGDRVELEVQGMGRLRVNVRDDLKRTWDRGTRLERTQKGLPARAEQLTGKYSKGNES